MRRIAATVRDARSAGRSADVARIVAFEGFGARRAGEAVALFADGTSAGSLLGGAVDGQLRAQVVTDEAGLVELVVGDAEAVSAGLACGGAATVLVTPAASVPEPVWSALAEGWPVAIVSALPDLASEDDDEEADGAGPSTVAFVVVPEAKQLQRHGLLGAGLEEVAEDAARRALRAGRDGSEVQVHGEVRLVIEAYFPSTTLLVVGGGALGAALAAQAGLLGWTAEIREGWDAAAADLVAGFGRADALVVCSHDPEVDAPALAAALATSCYVGALGSRHTQAARRERLAALGVEPSAVERIHGPVGLDVGARTPEETAVAVVAELLVHRSGRSATSLRGTSGPING